MRLNAKTALIVGAGRNMGKAIALTFAREGADLILVAREPGAEVKQVARECEALGVKALAIPADVTRHEEVNRMVQTGLEHFGKVDILVCTAAIRPHKPFWEYGYDEWLQVCAVNMHSVFYLAKALAPAMMQRKSGSIVVLGGLSSLSAELPHTAAVVASKHGVHGLIKSIARDLGPYGIRANLLALSWVESTRRNPEWYAKNGDPNAGKEATIPLRRLGTAQEVANAAVFLASEQSSYITGDRIVCAGGGFNM